MLKPARTGQLREKAAGFVLATLIESIYVGYKFIVHGRTSLFSLIILLLVAGCAIHYTILASRE
ncbi:MAG TPA: hypothetical protein VGK31_11275 [Thermoanaerobaculia bacterium]|jgi:hypothetical protein